MREAFERSRDGEPRAPGREEPPWAAPQSPAPWAFDDASRPMPAPDPPPASSRRPAPGPARRHRRRSLAVLSLLPAVALALYLARAAGRDGAGAPLRLSGVLGANEVVVSAQATGRIEHLAVTEGSWVAAGDLVARLDRAELEAERRNQLALIEELAARLRQTRELVLLEGDRGRGRVAGAEAQHDAAASQEAEAAAALDLARRDGERARRLFEGGLVSRQEVERLETDVRVSEARLRSLSELVARAAADLDLARAAERQTAVARRDVEQTQGRIEQARAALAQVNARLGYTSVRAPLAGMVSLRVARQGEIVRVGDPIVTVVDLDDVWLRAAVDEREMHRVAVGDAVDVELAAGGRVRGRVAFVTPEAQFATQRDVSREKRDVRTFGVKVALPNPARRLHPGMSAWLHLPAVAARAAR
jgi:HlyD family secretion protein